MPLNPEFKAKWIAALRSGNYKQTKYVLKSDDRYCCLGVACEVAGLKDGGTTKGSSSFVGPNGDDNHLIMPYSAAHALRLDDGDQKILGRMNDSEDSTFAQIADYIEANL